MSMSPLPERDEYWMTQALALAERAEGAGEVPVGALIVRDDEVLGEGWNQVIGQADPTAHAEIVALRAAARRSGNYRLPGTTAYVTLEPCPMCAGALVHARVERVVYGATDPRTGAAGSCVDLLRAPFQNHRCEVTAGVLSEPCAARLRDFFRNRRASN